MKNLFYILSALILFVSAEAQTVQEFLKPVKFSGLIEANEAQNDSIMVFGPDKQMRFAKKSTLISTPVLAHNELTGLQGGSAEQMYHLNSAQYNWIKAQLYTNHSASFSLVTTTGERGINVANTINYNIASNDDVITSASINQSIGSVFSNVDMGAKTIAPASNAESITYTLAIGYTRNGTAGSQNRNATYTAYTPRWYGSSATITDLTSSGYADLTVGNGFTKYVGNNNTMTYNANISTPAYVWFISPVPIVKITASGFDTTVGAWGDGSAFFWGKTISGFVLSNGTTTATMYVYRTRQAQNTGGSVIPFVFNP